MNFSILCISPYEGLNRLMKQVSQQLSPTTDRYDYHFLKFDRGEKVSVIDKKLQNTNADIVISRGGTASLLKKKLSIPVIDIGVSQLDLLNSVQSVEHIDRVALLAFAAITDTTIKIIRRFHLSIPVYTIQENQNVQAVFAQLNQEKIDTIIGDTTTESLAKQQGFNTLLITASQESVSDAFLTAFEILRAQKKNLTLQRTIKDYLSQQHQNILMLDNDLVPLLSTGLFSSDRTLRKQAITTWRRNNKRLSHHGVNYRLEVTQNKQNYPVLKLKQQVSREKDIPLMDIDDPNVLAAFAQYFRLTKSKQFFNLLHAYGHTKQPIVLLGEYGTGKMYIANQLIELSSIPSTKKLYINSTQHEELTKILSDDSSALYDSNQHIIFPYINFATIEDQSAIVDFIETTKLSERNQVIITIEQGKTDSLSQPLKTLISRGQLMSLPPLHALSGDEISLVITSLINEQNREQGSNLIGVSEVALDMILQEDWPDNFVQFFDVLTLAASSTSSDYIEMRDLQMGSAQYQSRRALQRDADRYKTLQVASHPKTLDDVIRTAVVNALDRNHGKRTQTAQELGISRATLWRYLKHG